MEQDNAHQTAVRRVTPRGDARTGDGRWVREGQPTMNERERTKLLFGPYKMPRLRYGDRTFCLYRDTAVKVIGISSARIQWPRCRGLEQRGGQGLLVDEELARAVRHESAAAVSHWWGVGMGAVTAWRKALGPPAGPRTRARTGSFWVQ